MALQTLDKPINATLLSPLIFQRSRIDIRNEAYVLTLANFYSFIDQTDNVDSFPGGAKIEDCSDGGKQRKVITILIGKDPLAPFNNPSDISYIFSTNNK